MSHFIPAYSNKNTQCGQSLSKGQFLLSLNISFIISLMRATVSYEHVSYFLSTSRSTIFVRLDANNHESLKYLPGDHLGVFPGNNEALVMTLIEKLEDAPPVNQIVKVEFLDERNTALGNYDYYYYFFFIIIICKCMKLIKIII